MVMRGKTPESLYDALITDMKNRMGMVGGCFFLKTLMNG
jgi:hypothetical protein